jgi:anti-sigma B factor antagonist
MNVYVKAENTTDITVQVEGRVDTTTAPDLEGEINSVMPKANKITLDCSKLIYISSAGLRVLLSAHKAMAKKGGKFELCNVGEDIMEIFSITGFSKILNIK